MIVKLVDETNRGRGFVESEQCRLENAEISARAHRTAIGNRIKPSSDQYVGQKLGGGVDVALLRDDRLAEQRINMIDECKLI